jgi:hypothetical protein
MALSLQDFTTEDLDYVTKLNNNNALLEQEVNSIASQLLAGVGEGALLMLDIFDRGGIVGAHSYRLDLDAYAGGSQIAIGRRPAFQAGLGEQNVSIAWGTFAGQRQRVQLTGDVTLNAASIVTGLPKTIYVGIPSSGTPQLFEDTSTLNVIYIYSMCWDGFNLSCIKRMSGLLPGYTLLQEIAAAPRVISVFDPETDWVSEAVGGTNVVLPGASDDNEILVDGSMEVIGAFVSWNKSGPDGMYAPGGTDNKVKLKLVSQGVTWSDSDFELDCSLVADEIFKKIAAGVGDDKFVTTVRRFQLERTYLGANVVSCRAFTWGLIVRPLLGTPVPKDTTKVVQI